MSAWMTIAVVLACLSPLALWLHERSRRIALAVSRDHWIMVADHNKTEAARMERVLRGMASRALERWELFDEETWNALKEWRDKE